MSRADPDDAVKSGSPPGFRQAYADAVIRFGSTFLLCRLLAGLYLAGLAQVDKPTPSPPAITDRARAPAWELREIEGWIIHIRRELIEGVEAELAERALELLRKQLVEIVQVVPASAVKELRRVPLYFSPEYPGRKPTAEFHPDAGWLRANGRDPAMAKAVEFSNFRQFEAEMDRMPNFVLHELAHAYHDRVLPEGFGNPEIKSAYERARTSGKYDRVERRFGTGKANTFERAYAMSDAMEYFAETSEALFSRNDFFPFNRDELKAHDPEMFALLMKLWGVPGVKENTLGCRLLHRHLLPRSDRLDAPPSLSLSNGRIDSAESRFGPSDDVVQRSRQLRRDGRGLMGFQEALPFGPQPVGHG